MAIYSNSRYSSGRVINVDSTRNGITRERKFVYTYDKVPADSPVASIHRTTSGDRLDILAYIYSGDSRLWWVIADVNNLFVFPLFLPVGIDLKIPTSEVFRRYGGV